MRRSDQHSIIALDKFIRATRDSGYKGTVSAISELVDNSLQARARCIAIFINEEDRDSDYPLELTVLDDGIGMDADILRQSLRFGGSTRFNDRTGLGRYGMGLPNASFSQARCVEVYTWCYDGIPLYTYIDVDEITSGEMTQVPLPRKRDLPAWARELAKSNGTLVHWSKCDRLDHRRISTLERKIDVALGRMFRYFLWDGVKIAINDKIIEPIDPLYLNPQSRFHGAERFHEALELEVRVPAVNESQAREGRVWATFSELPVHEWHALTNEEKRRLGIANGAGVSIVRAGREIEYGWFFMGRKRRENYDDWWRCEILFDPILDEAFGITHTKQQIRPQEYLQEVLAPEIEMIAKALNSRVRERHSQLKTAEINEGIESLVARKEPYLKPLPSPNVPDSNERLIESLTRKHQMLRKVPPDGTVEYRLIEDMITDTAFFTPIYQDGRIIVLINKRHQFYKRAYEPLLSTNTDSSLAQLKLLQALLLAAARAELMSEQKSERDTIMQFRQNWSDVLEVFLRS